MPSKAFQQSVLEQQLKMLRTSIRNSSEFSIFQKMYDTTEKSQYKDGYAGGFIPPFETVKDLVLERYLDLRNEYERPEYAALHLHQALVTYHWRSINGLQEQSLDDHLKSFEFALFEYIDE